MNDISTIETPPTPLPEWHIERLRTLAVECEWERVEHAGQLKAGDIYRIVDDSPLAEMFREVLRNHNPIFRVVRDPVHSPQGWILVTESTQVSLFTHAVEQV